MKILTIIPARGGSKGIPRKNVRLLGGRPLIAWSIEAARGTPGMQRVVVSTDDGEIASVSRAYGAEVVLRPAEISGDHATSESALLHALDHLQRSESYEPDLVVFLQATSPLRRPGDIRAAIDTLCREQADSLFSARHVEGFVWRQDRGGVAPVNYDPATRKRRQELDERILEENGSIYVFKPSVLRTANSRLGGKIAVHLMDELDSFQVDTLQDLERLEQLMRVLPGAAAGGGDQDSVDQLLKEVKLVVLDFDGVLTDNRVIVDQDGKESVACHRGDSLGLERARRAGIEILVLSKETNPVVEARCRKLKLHCVSGCDDKPVKLRELLAERGLQASQAAYVGNDINDLECMQLVGLPIAVADAVPAVLSVAKLITPSPGGRGAVRDVTDWLLEAAAKPDSRR